MTTKRFNPRLESLVSYKPVKPLRLLADELGFNPDQLLKLDGNENPYPTPPSVQVALANLDNIAAYPDPYSSELVAELSKNLQLPRANIVVGAGADELIDLLIRSFVPSNGIVVAPTPCFGMYKHLTKINGSTFVGVRSELVVSGSTASFKINEEELLSRSKQAELVFITRPNNPDGAMMDSLVVESCLDMAKLVVVDEAYIEFSGGSSLVKEVLKRDNLLVLRTFSKAFGLGGLRVGYGVVPTSVKELLTKIKQPYNVNKAGEAAAIASLVEPTILENVELMKATRDLTLSQLRQEGEEGQQFSVFDSKANFILICFLNSQVAQDIYFKLRKRGILTRYYSEVPLDCCLRVSVGTSSQMDRFMLEFRNVTKEVLL